MSSFQVGLSLYDQVKLVLLRELIRTPSRYACSYAKIGLRFVFDYPRGLSNIPAYSGKVMIAGDNGELLSVPYFGRFKPWTMMVNF